MRTVLVVGVCVLLTGCGRAVAAEPDSKNPTHCAAALNMAAVWNEKAKSRPHPEWSNQYRAGGLYLLEELKESGGDMRQSHDEAVAFTKAYWTDPRMPTFVLECLKGLARDQKFRAQEQEWIALAERSKG